MASRTRSGERAAVVPAPGWRTRLAGVRTTRLARALTVHEHRTAAGLFALLVLAYLWPVLVGGKVLLPTALMYQFAPWAGSTPPDVLAYANGALGDVPISYYPWQVLARDLLHAGTLPAWNPYALAGTPFFANPEVAWLSPFSLPLWVLPLHWALGFAAALKLWMAGFGAYLLARELRLGFWPGIVPGVGFALCAFNVVWLSHGVQVSVAVLLPWLLWLVERLVRRGRPGDGLALAGIVAFVLTGGHPGTQLHVLTGAVVYGLARAALSGDVAVRERARRLGLIGAGLLVGGMLTAVVLLPAQQAALDTAGAAARRAGSAEFLGSRMGADALRAALFPDWWGRPSEQVYAGPAYYNERAFYAGAAAIVLAGIGLLAGGAWRRKAPFALLGALGAALAVRVPGLHEGVTSLPLFDAVQNQRILLWFALAVSVLAAFGLQAVLDAPRPWRAWLAVALAAVPVLIALASIAPSGATLSHALEQLVDRRATTAPEALALASVLRFAPVVAALAAILLLVRLRPRVAWLVGPLVVLLVCADMLQFVHGYQPMGPADRVVPPRTPAIAYLQRHAGEGRMTGIAETLAADFSNVYGLRDVAGNDPPQPSMRFYRLWKAVEPAQTPGAALRISTLAPATVRVLGLLGARHLIAPPGTLEDLPVVDPVYRGGDATIFRNREAAPRAFVAARVHVAGNEDGERAAVLDSRFDPRRHAVVRRDELGSIAALRAAPGGTVAVVDEDNASVTLRASLPHPGVVVLDDGWAPGWRVEVDGRPATALQANVVLRGVLVPAGTHTVVWRYRVPGLRSGAALSLVGLLAAGGWGAWLVWCRARRRATPGRS